MKMKKIVATGSALALTAAVAVGGTLAYLNASTLGVQNSFTYTAADQNVTLKLFEHKLNENDPLTVVKDDGHKLYAGEDVKQEYTIVPGAEAQKDPTLELKSGKTKVYVYAEVKETDESNAITVNMLGTWRDTGLQGKNGGDVYVLIDSEDRDYAAATETAIPVFETITYANINGALDAKATVDVYGYAVDVTAGETANEAFTAAFGAQA